MRIARALVSGCVIAALAVPFGACAQFSSGECTDKALCDPNEASANDTTAPDAPGDAIVDVKIDTFVGPDGNVPDGECNGGAEDCANGKDDNCDGLVDCADPVCQGAGYACTAAAPSGWNGPVAWFDAAGGTIPSCAAPYATQGSGGHAGITAPAAQCGCGCTGPTSVQCNQVGVTYYSDNNCQTSAGGAGLPTNFCVTTGSGSSVAAQAQPTAFNGNCGSNPSKTLPAISWANSDAVCTYNAPSDVGGCNNGSLCMEQPPTGANAKACVWQSGDVACPGAPYTQKTVFYTSVDDQRDCTTCTCTATAGSCNAQVTVYSLGSCNTSGSFVGIMTDNSCHQFNGVSAIAGPISVTPGTCGSGGTGGPTGTASASGPITVCCP
ncbi:MAG TPA: hypothetical protein VH054_25900 [Polyangiaceae bacterium]|nr:hypothetical protein [Polyangiaceae bacterium]